MRSRYPLLVRLHSGDPGSAWQNPAFDCPVRSGRFGNNAICCSAIPKGVACGVSADIIGPHRSCLNLDLHASFGDIPATYAAFGPQLVART